ncbi:MAG: NUDIX hydrolase [Nocardioides sp.]|uniref:NUDIX domain-containing protein n=1 Tax=Nocardioides sp. TaxID=35761 RepID=UPI0039E70F22
MDISVSSDFPGGWERPERWPVVESTDLHRDDWVMALRRDRIQQPGAPTETPFGRLVLEHPGAVVVLAVDAEDRVLVLSQYRHPAGRRFLELPAGLIDEAGEEPLDVARRELREEAAYAAARWRPLLTAYSSPGISAERIHYFLARDLTSVDRGDFVLAHEEADMSSGWVPVEDLIDAALDGRAQDAPMAVAVLAYDALRRRGRLD